MVALRKGNRSEGDVNEYLSIVFLMLLVVEIASYLTNICSNFPSQRKLDF